jgi:hypothetical protein
MRVRARVSRAGSSQFRGANRKVPVRADLLPEQRSPQESFPYERRREMTKTSTLIASAAVIALTLGVTSRADVPTKKESILPPGAIIVAADEAQPENTQGSAKMGEEAGTQQGTDIGVVPENDTKKGISRTAETQPAQRRQTRARRISE